MKPTWRGIAAVADEIMTYRRDPSDIGVIVRQPQERHANTTMRHPSADATLAGVQTRAHATLPTISRDAVPFGAPQPRPPVVRPSADSATETPHAPAGHPEVILVKSGFKQVATRVREILYVEAARNYVRIHMESGTVFKSRVPIDRLALHLGRERFLRIHRGCIVNVDRVRAVTPLVGGRLLLALSDGSRVTAARDRRRFVLAEIGAGTGPRS
jgi:DNA-binding LytR/AlgR family response regulator